MSESHNPACPDYFSHQVNVADRHGWTDDLLTPEQDAIMQREAEEEYTSCEGH